MSYNVSDFQNQLLLVCGTHRWNANLNAYLTLFASALTGDTTVKHDTTIETAPGILAPNFPANDKYETEMAKLVNRGRAGGLTTAQMSAVFTTVQTLVPGAIPH